MSPHGYIDMTQAAASC